MSKLTKQSVVSIENYNEIKNMVMSNDEASVNVGITIMEQADFEKSAVYIMCLLKDCFKETFGTKEKFVEQAPNLSEKIINSLEGEIDVSKLSTKAVYKFAQKRAEANGNMEERSFVLGNISTELKGLLSEFGYEFVDYTEIFVKPLGWTEDNDKLINSLKSELASLKGEVLV